MITIVQCVPDRRDPKQPHTCDNTFPSCNSEENPLCFRFVVNNHPMRINEYLSRCTPGDDPVAVVTGARSAGLKIDEPSLPWHAEPLLDPI